MSISFAPSARSSLGIEWEIALVDSVTRELVPTGPAIMSDLRSRNIHGAELAQVSGELLQNTVELISSPHRTVSDAVEELRCLADALLTATDAHGVVPIAPGCHPFSRWEDQPVTASPRYRKFMERYQWWGRNQLIWGVHIHVGIEDRTRVPAVLHALLTYLPHLIALSSSSPFWAGQVTGYASNRTLWFQQLPTAGLPWSFETWEEYEHIINDLTRTGVIAEVTEARWDIRPAPKWGTIEVRACDGLSTLWEIGAVAAFVQCLCEHFNRLLDAGEDLPRLQPWFLYENKWRAARYGLATDIIVDPGGSTAPISEHVRQTIAELEPVADALGCRAELADVLRIIKGGSSADRQLRTLTEAGGIEAPGALAAVVDTLAEELAASIDRSTETAADVSGETALRSVSRSVTNDGNVDFAS